MQSKPYRPVFLLFHILGPAIFLTITAIIAAPILGYVSLKFLPPVFVVWAGLMLLTVLRARIAYAKENYQLDADRIFVRRGGLFSDAEAELHLHNITHVKWVRPWLKNKFFGVGDLHIEAAGSAASEAVFRDLKNSAEAYRRLRHNMRSQGFSISTEMLLHQERPADLGITAEIVAGGIGGFFGLALVLGPALIPAAMAFPPLILLAPVLAGIGIFSLVIHYLDLKRRVYSVYDGVIEYHEGFLTRNDAFIPVENLSNSEISRSVIDRLTNLYQVTISCQGAGQEIKFRHLAQGEKLDRVLEDIINTQAARRESEPIHQAAAPAGSPASACKPVPGARDTATTASFTMHGLRTLTPFLLCLALLPLLIVLFPLLIVMLILFVYAIVRLKNTTYHINRNSIKEEFAFLTSKTREFSTDKITGITFRESVIDRHFGTCSIKFWSIGAADEITFHNISKEERLYEIVRAKAGIKPAAVVYEIKSCFTPAAWLSASLPIAVVWGLILAISAGLAIAIHWGFAALGILALLLVVARYFYAQAYYARSQVRLYEGCLVFRRGLIIQEATYALYPNVKDISTLKYPFVDNGYMQFNVAGERIQQTKNGENRIPYGFTIRYVPDILNMDDIFDRLLLGRTPEAAKVAPVMAAGKAPGNTLAAVALVSVILPPLILLLPLTLAIALWRVRLVTYIIEPDRVLLRKGALYRKQTSIIFDRIDQIQTSRNFLNNFFKNGNIIIRTAGSSTPELVLKNIPDWRAFHEELRRHY